MKNSNKHSAPGVYFKETDLTYSTPSMGLTTLGVAGETLRGPAFQPISIDTWAKFQTYFGGTSTAKFKGSQYPKYELPFIAKTYLEQSQQLEVVRTLGLSGVNAGPAWVITATKHKTFSGYVYDELQKEPTVEEGYWEELGHTVDKVPQYPDVTELNPSPIRMLTGYRWESLCTELPQEASVSNVYIDGEYDEETNAPTLEDDYMGMMQSTTAITNFEIINNYTDYSSFLDKWERDMPPTYEAGSHYIGLGWNIPLTEDAYFIVKYKGNFVSGLQASDDFVYHNDGMSEDGIEVVENTIADGAFTYSFIRLKADTGSSYILIKIDTTDIIGTHDIEEGDINFVQVDIPLFKVSYLGCVEYNSLPVEEQGLIKTEEVSKSDFDLDPSLYPNYNCIDDVNQKRIRYTQYTIDGVIVSEDTYNAEVEKYPVIYYYISVPVYSYYKKVYKTNVQTAEEDDSSEYLNTVIAVLRSRGEHKKSAFVRHPNESDIENGICDDIYAYDGIEYYAQKVRLEPTNSLKLSQACIPGYSSNTGDFTVNAMNYGTFTIVVTNNYGEEMRYPVSLNKSDKNYIYNVLGSNPEIGESEVFIEELYDVALQQMIERGEVNAINSELAYYPTVYIVPEFEDVTDILINPEDMLTKRDIGKRYLYSQAESVDSDGNPLQVHYTSNDGKSWEQAEGIVGMIYTVTSIFAEDGSKEYVYGSYVSDVNYHYVMIPNEDATVPDKYEPYTEKPSIIPADYNFYTCDDEFTGAQKNWYGHGDGIDNTVFTETYAESDSITSTSPLYVRVEATNTGSEEVTTYYWYKKELKNIQPIVGSNHKTEALQPFDFAKQVQSDNIFTNAVEVVSDKMMYILLVNEQQGLNDVFPVTLDFNNYKEQYRYSSTPWVVSEVQGSANNVDLTKLFRFHTISDGAGSVTEVKISIENIEPEAGTFDVVVRDFYDTDANIQVLERYTKVNLVPGDSNYIALRIGSFDGNYEPVSKLITVEVNETERTKLSTPCGFIGYPVRNFDGTGIYDNNYNYVYVRAYNEETDLQIKTFDVVPSVEEITSDEETYPNVIHVGNGIYRKQESVKPTPMYFKYNTILDEDIRVKKQYFGISDIAGVDEDVFRYKGVEAYNEMPEGLTPCFHLDARIFNGKPDNEGYIVSSGIKQRVCIDGIYGYSWSTVDKNNVTTAGEEPRIGTEETMMGTIYEDKKTRKFTMCFYGGFDGWDYYRTSRSNTDDFKYNKYKGTVNKTSGKGTMLNVLSNPEDFGFEGTDKCLTSDYYAYLAAIKQFSNPNNIDINVLATPGIDYVNNKSLVAEVIDMVEDDRSDALYIVTTPDKPFGASDSESDMYSAKEAVWNLEDSDIDSNHVCSYFPWEKYYDENSAQYIFLPITRDVCRSIAYTDNIAFPWYSAAGFNRGTLSGVRPKKKLKQNECDTLYEGRLNFIQSFALDGDRIWGDKNLQIEDSQMNRISKRRLLLRIKKLCQKACVGFLFDPNDITMKKSVNSAIDEVLSNIKSNRGVYDYKIVVDDSAEARERLEMNVKIFIKPTPNLEYINIEAVITPQGVVWA